MSPNVPIFKSVDGEAKSVAAYAASLACWPVPYEELNAATRLGATHVVRSGPATAKPLILLHGQDSSATSWLYNMADLSKAFQCYAIDTPGDFGKSRPTRLPASRADYADWLLDVFDALQFDKADIAGLSYGGFLAVNFALAHPQRVHRMVLMAPGIPNFGPMTLQWANYGMPMLLLPSRTTIRRFIRGVSTKGYQADDPVHEQMIIGILQLQHATFVRPVFSNEELRELCAPTLLLIGDHEIMYEPRKAVERARQLVPTMQAELVPNAGHMLNSDQPAIVDESMLAFLLQD